MYYDPTLCDVQIGRDDTKYSRYLYREIRDSTTVFRAFIHFRKHVVHSQHRCIYLFTLLLRHVGP